MAADTKRGASLGLGVWHGEGYYKALDLDGLRALLAAQGLHVVAAAEKAVLDAAEAMTVRYDRKSGDIITTGTLDVVRAELARREAAK